MKKNIFNKKKAILLSAVGILALLVITVGVTYSVFTYTKIGTTENTMTSGTLKFLYIENSGSGNGIKLTNAFPVTDEVGKKQIGDNNVFDFKVEGENTSDNVINYEITLRKSSESTLDEKVLKVYLTDITENEDSELLGVSKYNDLKQTYINVGDNIEKTLYIDKVPAHSSSYEKSFRLRMWVDENTNFATGEYDNKIFKTTVNVYADTNIISEPTAYTSQY